MKKQKLQWHPAFFAGLQIELKDDADNLIFENEHQLGTKPKEIDILVIKKQKDIPVKKNIGRIFRKHNIIEYKSPTDYVSIDDFYKGCAYVLFYKSDTATQNEIHIEDITLTFVCVEYPQKLMKHLEEELRYSLYEFDNGIYYVCKIDNILPIQIVVTSKLNIEENLWLKSLTNHLPNEDDTKRLITEYEANQTNKLYESVMDIIIKANKLEDCNMSVVLDNWLESLKNKALTEGRNEGSSQGRSEGLSQGRSEGLSQGLSHGIEIFIIDALEDGKTEEIIIAKLMRHYKISEDEAKGYFDKYAFVSK